MRKYFVLVGSVLATWGSVVACNKGDPGPAGPKGEAGTTVVSIAPATFGMVVPRTGLLGGNGEYVVTVAGEMLAAGVALDFGNDVSTDNVTLISPTSLSVHVSVATTAAIGPRDVRVILGSTAVTGASAFIVEAPLLLRPMPPSTTLSAGQGSLLFLALTNLNPTGAWDPTPGAFTVTSTFGGLLTTAVGGANTTATNAYIAFAADPLAAPGPAQVIASNINAAGMPLTSLISAPAAISVTAATPKPLMAAAPLTAENLPQPGASNYYALATTSASIVDVSTVASGVTIAPTTLAYPASGLFKDLLLLSVAPSQSLLGHAPPSDVVFGTANAPSTTFLVVYDAAFDGGAATDFGYSLVATVTPATAVAEQATPHATDPTAQPLTPGTGIVVSGTLGAPGEYDVYSFVAAAGDLWQLSYTEGSSSVLGVALDNGGLPDLKGNPLVILQPAAPSHSASNQGRILPITSVMQDAGVPDASPPDASRPDATLADATASDATPSDASTSSGNHPPGTYYIAVVGSPAQAPNQAYTFTLLNTRH